MAQTSLLERLETLKTLSQEREKIFVHTNNTSYLANDVIWFKAYVARGDNVPSLEAHILVVGLFDIKGNELFNRNVEITNGTGFGQFELNNALTPGTYFLLARNRYSRKLKDDHYHLQKIEILSDVISQKKGISSGIYEIGLFPEGGTFIEDVQNTLGIKVLADGEGCYYNGTIIGQNKDTVASFQSVHEGMSKISFLYKKGEKYTARIKLRDTVLEHTVPIAEEKGVSLQIDNSDKTFLKVFFKTNKVTLQSQHKANYTLLYRHEGGLTQMVEIGRLHLLSGSLKTKKDIFKEGVNTAILFLGDRPIAERKFYIHPAIGGPYATIEEMVSENDSMVYRLNLEGLADDVKVDLSISVLKKGLHNKEQGNIRSSFLLEPFITPQVGRNSYYFNEANKGRAYFLDLLLLNQERSIISLDQLLQNQQPSERNYDIGFELKGKAKGPEGQNTLVLLRKDYQIIGITEVKGNAEFEFQNLKIYKGDTLLLAFKNKQGILMRPLSITYDSVSDQELIKPLLPQDVAGTFRKMHEVQQRKEEEQQPNILVEGNPIDFGSTIDLEEVVVSGKKRSEKFQERRRLIKKYEHIVPDIGKYYDLTVPDSWEKYNATLFDVLALQGFRLRTWNNVQQVLVDTKNTNKTKMALLYINGSLVDTEEYGNITLQWKDIANLMVSREGNTTKFQAFTIVNKEPPFDSVILKKGIDRPKSFYVPTNYQEQIEPSKNYVVDWKPSLNKNADGQLVFKVAKGHQTENLVFCVQGFSENGLLISDILSTY
jgi:hypothetical protein